MSGSVRSTLLASLLLPAAVLSAPAATCNTVQIFVAVGHGETYPGTQQGIVRSVCQGMSSCGYQEIPYRARDSGNYCIIGEEGIKNGVAAMTKYATDCPDAKLVITGWSQGGWLVGDILGGGGGPGKGAAQGCTQKDNTGLDPATFPGNKIVAATIFGDPRHTAGQKYNEGTGASKDGVWPRPANQLAGLAKWTDKLKSYCTNGDPACTQGSDWNAHGGYFSSQPAAAPVAFIKSKLA